MNTPDTQDPNALVMIGVWTKELNYLAADLDDRQGRIDCAQARADRQQTPAQQSANARRIVELTRKRDVVAAEIERTRRKLAREEAVARGEPDPGPKATWVPKRYANDGAVRYVASPLPVWAEAGYVTEAEYDEAKIGGRLQPRNPEEPSINDPYILAMLDDLGIGTPPPGRRRWPGGPERGKESDDMDIQPYNSSPGGGAPDVGASATATLDPPAPPPGKMKDSSDFLAAGGTAAQLLALADAAPPWTPPPTLPAAEDTRPDRGRIEIGPDEYRVVREALAALALEPDIFYRGGLLVRTIRADPAGLGLTEGPLTIAPLPGANLRERLTARCEFVKANRAGELHQAHPPPWLIEALLARGEWPGLRPLAGISDIPVLRADGTLHTEPGYDFETCTLYAPRGSRPDVPTRPTRADAMEAAERLFDIVIDFRFEAPEHRSAWLAALLTPLARTAFTGPAPAVLIDSNVRGSGKGLLAQVIGIVVTGVELSPYSYTNDSEELRKKITAVAIAGDRIVLLDNIDGDFGNDALDRALTATRWRDRILGRSELVDLPLRALWIGTGNNIIVAADTCRRLIHVRLDVMVESPENRTDFKYPALLEHVREYRTAFAADALTILAAFLQSGDRIPKLTGLGSFEGWSQTVREAVMWCGLSDPAKTRIGLAEKSDTTKENLRGLLKALWEYAGGESITVAPMIRRLYGPPLEAGPAADAMRGILASLTGGDAVRAPDGRKVGKQLAKFRRRVVDGLYLDRLEVRRGAGVAWQVYSADTGSRE